MAIQEINGEKYMPNGKGALIPVAQIKEIDLARHELVVEKAIKAEALQKTLTALKYEIMADVEAFVGLSAERYDVKLGGVKGNVTLVSFDGQYQIKRQIGENLVFDEGLQAAKALIDECIKEWSKDSPSELKAIVDDTFQTDKEGKLNISRILGLRRLDIEHERWQLAMKAIGDSVQVSNVKPYVRVYKRDAHGAYNAITLDMAAL